MKRIYLVKSGNVIGRVADAMALTNASSKNMVDFVSLIEGMTLPASVAVLNAAVEAARTRAQECGFEVMSGAGRSLPHRCTAAANDSNVLIDN